MALRMARAHSKYGAVAQWVLPDLRVVPASKVPKLPPGVLRFASKREADRFVFLKMALDAGEIAQLVLQPAFSLGVITPRGERRVITRYLADFAYRRDGRRVIEDAKGFRTRVYILKKAWVEAEYGIEIREV